MRTADGQTDVSTLISNLNFFLLLDVPPAVPPCSYYFYVRIFCER
jgi:hypothetical protein